MVNGVNRAIEAIHSQQEGQSEERHDASSNWPEQA